MKKDLPERIKRLYPRGSDWTDSWYAAKKMKEYEREKRKWEEEQNGGDKDG